MSYVIQTDRLLLRRFLRSDLDELCRLYADPLVRRFFPGGVLSRAETEEELDWSIDGGEAAHPDLRLFAAIDRASGRFVGRGGYVCWDLDGSSEIEIAYMLDRSVWRRGLGTEMARGLLGHGFRGLGVERLIAVVDPANMASRGIAQGVGMRLEHAIVHDGLECIVFAITADEWRTREERPWPDTARPAVLPDPPRSGRVRPLRTTGPGRGLGEGDQ